MAALNGLCNDPNVIMWVATTTNASKPIGWEAVGRKLTVRAIDFRDRFTVQKMSVLLIFCFLFVPYVVTHYWYMCVTHLVFSKELQVASGIPSSVFYFERTRVPNLDRA